MKITFVIPAYNAERTLQRTVRSVLSQTDERYDIILVDDGSTDHTPDICREFKGCYGDKITYIRQENRGLGGARNRGMELVRTEYVSFLDSDDWLMPEYVETILKHLTENPVEMVMVLPQIYHERSRCIIDWYDREVFQGIFDTDGRVIEPCHTAEVYRLEVNQCRKVLSMDFVKRTGFCFREQIKWEDVFPHFFLLSQCRSCMGIRSTGFYYRIGGSGQITASQGEERLDVLTVFEDLISYLIREEKKELRFPAMRVIVRFSIWCIRMSEDGVRQKLVKRLHRFYRELPGDFCGILRRESRRTYSRADAMQYRLFVTAIKSRFFHRIFYDYLYQEVGERLIKGLLGAKERVA